MYYNTTLNTVRICTQSSPSVVWQGLGAGANQQLSNLSAVAVNSDLLPQASDTINLGNSSFPWADLQVVTATFQMGAIHIDSTSGGTLWLNFLNGNDGDESIVFAPGQITATSDTGLILSGFTNTVSGTLQMLQASTDGTNYIGFTVSPTLGATTTYQWPSDGTSGYLLSTSGTGVLSWVPAPVTGANQYLSNLLSPTAINQDLLPGITNNYQLGTLSQAWYAIAANSLSSPGALTIQSSGGATITINPSGGIIQPEGNIVPNSPTYNLGSSTDYWAAVYASLIKDSVNVTSIDVINRQLKDSSGIEAISYQSRQLWAQLGPTEIMSWGNSGVSISVAMALNGSTSGAITQQAAATTTSYSVTWPAAQASGTQVLQNNGSGILSWATVSGSSGAPTVMYYTVTPTDITNGYMTLSSTPASPTSTLLDVIGGTAQVYTTDFTVSGAQLSWAGTLASSIASGDVLRIAFW